MKRSSNLLLAALAVLATAGCVNEDGGVEAAESKNTQVIKAASEYWAEHPDDYAGLARAIEDAGGDTVRFSFNKPGLQGLTGEEAQAAYSAFAAEGSEPVHGAAASDVPVNAFEVGASWYHVQDQYGEWWNFDGKWNYRDDYIGSGSPDNASGIAVEGMDEKCWRQDGDWMHAAAYDGANHSDLTYRKDVDAKSSVWGVRDRTSGFKLLTDHGTHTISFKRIGDGCGEKPSGKYYWEHNQDGGSGGWSFSINLAIFSISYADNSGGMTLQKSSGLTHRP